MKLASLRKHFIWNSSAILFFIIIVFTLFPRPLTDWSNRLPDTSDSVIALTIIKWDQRCVATPLLHCSDLPIFYPVKGALYFTEHMYGVAGANIILRAMGFDIHAAYNLTFLFFVFLNFTISWLLFKYKWKLGYISSLLGAMSFAAQPFILNYLSHIQLAPAFFFPLALWCITNLLNGKNTAYYWLALVVASQFWFSMTLGIFVAFMITSTLVVLTSFNTDFKSNINLHRLLHIRHVLAAAALTFVLLFPLLWNYGLIAHAYEFTRNLTDSIPFSTEPMALLVNYLPFDLLKIAPNIQHWSESRFLGWLFPCVIVAFFLTSGNGEVSNRAPRSMLGASVVLMVLFAILMFGPYLIVNGRKTNIPLPYSLFYYGFPGFNAMRVPVRFVVPAVFMGSVALALLWDRLSHRIDAAGSRIDWIMHKTRPMIFLLLAAGWGTDRMIKYSDGILVSNLQPLPVVYNHIEIATDEPLLELPVWPPSVSVIYFYYSLFDNRPRLGGLSSFFPKIFFALRDVTDQCPSVTCLRYIESTKTKTIIVHLDKMPAKKAEMWKLQSHDFGNFVFKGVYESSLLWERR